MRDRSVQPWGSELSTFCCVKGSQDTRYALALGSALMPRSIGHPLDRAYSPSL